MFTKFYRCLQSPYILICLLSIIICVDSQETAIVSQKYNETKNTENIPKREDLTKTLSRSKASVWVDTNKGNIYSTSIGSSHLERNPNRNNTLEGRSSNMMLTLLLQPASSTPVSQVNLQGNESSLKPILLLLQQQQDLSELLLEKQEKLEKMNVHLQQQVKHQHLLMVELLEQIKMFLELINAPNFAGVKTQPTDEMNRIKHRIIRDRGGSDADGHSTSASSTANAVVTAPKLRSDSPLPNAVNQIPLVQNIPAFGPNNSPESMASNRFKPIIATSASETKGQIKV